MWLLLLLYLGSPHIIQNCFGIKYIDVENHNDKDNAKGLDSESKQYDNLRKSNPSENTRVGRRRWDEEDLSNRDLKTTLIFSQVKDEEKDEKLKGKIVELVEQTVQETAKKVESVSYLKASLNEEGPYRIGFILSMIKKSNEVLNELYNVAIKHRYDWRALEQLKIFELIVHTNVDTTNLVRRLAEFHVMFMNTTMSTI